MARGDKAKKVREYCKQQYIKPVREKNKTDFLIRAGDVVEGLKLQGNESAAVCAVIGANEFENDLGVRRIAFDGPIHGSNAWFWFRLNSERFYD